MKKYLKVMAILLVAITLVGCNTKKAEDKKKDDDTKEVDTKKDSNNNIKKIESVKEVKSVCTLNKNADETSVKSEYNIYSTEGYVDKVETIETVIADSDDILDEYEKLVKNTYSTYNKKYGGYTFDIDRKSDKLIVNTTIDYKKMDLEAFAEDNDGMESYMKNGKLSLTGIKELYESIGADCE